MKVLHSAGGVTEQDLAVASQVQVVRQVDSSAASQNDSISEQKALYSDLSAPVGVFHAHLPLSLEHAVVVRRLPHGVTTAAVTGLVAQKNSVHVHLLNCSVDPVLIASKRELHVFY